MTEDCLKTGLKGVEGWWRSLLTACTVLCRYVHLYSIVDKDVGDMRLGEKLDCNRLWKHRTHTDWVTKVSTAPTSALVTF
jgi:hypothetical protein